MLRSIETLWWKVLHVMLLDGRGRGRQEKEIFEGSQFGNGEENWGGCITSIRWGFYRLWCFRGGREGEEGTEQDVPGLLRVLLLVEFVVWVGVRMKIQNLKDWRQTHHSRQGWQQTWPLSSSLCPQRHRRPSLTRKQQIHLRRWLWWWWNPLVDVGASDSNVYVVNILRDRLPDL